MVEAAFSEDVLEAGNNSEVIELPQNKFVVVSVRHHNQPEVKPLAEVRDEVLAAVTDEANRAAVMAQARQALQQLSAGVPMQQIAGAGEYPLQVELGVDRGNTVVQPEVLRRLFELPAPDTGVQSADVVMMPNGDAVVVQLLQVSTGEYASLPAAERAQLQQALTGEFSGLIDSEFQSGLRDRADIKVM